MTRIVFSLACVILLFCSSKVLYAHKWYAGIHGGYLVNNKKIVDQNIDPFNMDQKSYPIYANTTFVGFHCGYYLSSRWGVEAQFQLGSELSEERLRFLYEFHSGAISGIRVGVVDWLQQHRYGRLGVLAHFNFLPPTATWSVRLLVGPSMAHLYRFTSNYIGVDELGKEIAPTIQKDGTPIKKWDIGLQLAGRIQKNMTPNCFLFIEGGFYQGFRNTLVVPSPYTRPLPDYYYQKLVNQYFTASLGIQLSWHTWKGKGS